MDNPVKKLSLPNGLTILFVDHSRQYFGDFYRVKLEIICRIPILESYFTDPEEFVQARAMVGEMVVYRRMEERMGVPSLEIETALQKLVKNFIDHSVSYFKADNFPRKIILSEMLKKIKRARNNFPIEPCEY